MKVQYSPKIKHADVYDDDSAFRNVSFIYSEAFCDLATIRLPANYSVVEGVSRFLYAKIACSG